METVVVVEEILRKTRSQVVGDGKSREGHWFPGRQRVPFNSRVTWRRAAAMPYLLVFPLAGVELDCKESITFERAGAGK